MNNNIDATASRRCRLARSVAMAALVVLFAGCANIKVPEVIADRLPGAGSAPASTPSASTKAPPVGTSRGINLAGNCKQTEVDGFAEDAQVQVAGGAVNALSWKMTIGKKGSCSFDGNSFRQTKTAPSIEMTAKDGSGCRLLMWSDDRRITLAHNNCEKFCTKGVYAKAWPVMFDPRSGGCADTSR